MDKVGIYDFCAEPFHCDFSHRLFMGHLGNYMLNAAEFHSTDRGFGFEYLNSINKTWVLSRLAIEVEDMPRQFEKFKIETWVESAMRYFTNRSFRVVDNDGHVYCYGRSVWAMIDTESRQPQNLLEVRNGELTNWIETDKKCPINNSSRVKMSKDAPFVRTIDTYYSDVDINGHINSIKYIEHVFDLFDAEWYKEHAIKRFEIAYVAETYLGDKLNFYREQSSNTVGEEKSGANIEDKAVRYCIRITKTPMSGGEEAEVCRCMMDFK